MIKHWKDCKNILCIRLDNMGDVMMSSPAFNALKETFNCKITLLTSPMGKNIAEHISVIDDVIVFNVPWVKLQVSDEPQLFFDLIHKIKAFKFDGAVVFSVFSQNPLPAVMIAYLAEIPLRLAYCRENPYQLLTDWVPDKEPYFFIQHQVRRDLQLVNSIGADTTDDRLKLNLNIEDHHSLLGKLHTIGFNLELPWVIFHPGVSERKREYPIKHWIETAKMLAKGLNYQIVLTGTDAEHHLCDQIRKEIDQHGFNVSGLLSLSEFINLVNLCPLVVSVNTSTIHIAAATGTPVVVLYAMTNPQHTPWKTYGKVLPFPVDDDLKSKNEVLNFIEETYYPDHIDMILPSDIYNAIRDVLQGKSQALIPELVVDHDILI